MNLPLLFSAFCFSLAGLMLFANLTAADWRTADRNSAGIAPATADEPEALVHVYAARAFNWRGYFAVHSWIATKEKNADQYVSYQVMGYNLYRGESPVVIRPDVPDRRWYGAEPQLLYSVTGKEAEQAIPLIRQAAESYPYPMTYHVWPGPNSNTFIAHIIRNVPQLRMELPPHAIGKDWLTNGHVVARSESGTGVQFSLFGVLGATAGKAEGLEVNVLGLNFGVDILRPALKLPIIGRLGMSDAPLDSCDTKETQAPPARQPEKRTENQSS